MWQLLCVMFIGVRANTINGTTGKCRALDGSGFNSSTFLMNKRAVSSDAAVCNDGTQAQFYFRPCCDGETAGDFCNESLATWLIVFGDGHEDGWCWDVDSCAARALASPQLVSSDGLPQVFSRDGENWTDGVGAFSKGGEVNQNFYKSYAVYVPHCSSDLFLGECSADAPGDAQFCGRSIAEAVVRQLLPEMATYGVDEVVLVGGAGVMTYASSLRDILPQTATVSAVCDGCVLFDDLAPLTEPPTCEDAFSCTPDRTLPAGVDLWGASLDEACGGWRCLLSTAGQGSLGLVAATSAKLPLLAQQPLYDSKTFSALGSTPTQNATFAQEVRKHIHAGLKAAKVIVASACTAPESSFTRSSFFLVSFGRFYPRLSYASGLYALLYESTREVFADSCSTVDCNPSCQQLSVLV